MNNKQNNPAEDLKEAFLLIIAKLEELENKVNDLDKVVTQLVKNNR